MPDFEQVLTPALVIYPALIASDIKRTLALLNGDTDRWRVHIKTAKLGFTVHMLIEHGVRNFKCATTLELMTACDVGAADVLSHIQSWAPMPVVCVKSRRFAGRKSPFWLRTITKSHNGAEAEFVYLWTSIPA